MSGFYPFAPARQINGERMAEIAAILDARPDRHDQDSWFTTPTAWPDGSAVARDSGGALVVPVPAEALRRVLGVAVPLNVADAISPICNATGCVAGIDAMLAVPDGTMFLFAPNPDDGEVNGELLLPDGSRRQVEEFAAEDLGLSWSQAGYLFSGSRRRGEVRRALDYLPLHPAADGAELADRCGAGTGF